MPAYVAARQYYRKMIGGGGTSSGGGSALAVEDDVMYVIPSKQYKYDHPEGTGYEMSPFDSLWFCCIGRDNVSSFKQKLLTSSSSPGKHNTHSSRIRIATSLQQLATMGIIKLDNRPNPKQRRKKNKNRQQVTVSSSMTTTVAASTSPPPAATTTGTASKFSVKKRQYSKYRDEEGERKKKRF